MLEVWGTVEMDILKLQVHALKLAETGAMVSGKRTRCGLLGRSDTDTLTPRLASACLKQRPFGRHRLDILFCGDQESVTYSPWLLTVKTVKMRLPQDVLLKSNFSF